MKLHFLVGYSGMWPPQSCIGDLWHWFYIGQISWNVAYFKLGIRYLPLSLYIWYLGVRGFLWPNPLSHFFNGDICGSFCFSWVDTLFFFTNVQIGWYLICAFLDVISGEVYLLSDDCVTHMPVICNNRNRIITTVFLLWGSHFCSVS